MKTTLIFLSLIFLASCNQIEKRGYSFELSDYQSLQEGISTKDEALKAMGYPSLVEDFESDELWIYYSEDIKKLLFFKPKILDRKIMTINFDSKKYIKKISSYDLSNQSEIIFSKNYTTIINQKSVDKPSWWKQIFDNIGQVRPN